MPNGTMAKKIPSDFYQEKTKKVAKLLLGKKLVRVYRGERISGIITEVEAYLGLKDRACHSFGERRTDRTKPLYLSGGHSYIYFIYGMYHCFNVVTEKEGVPEAVLVRALEPVEGISWMERFRQSNNIKNLTTGPGKLAEALHLTKELNAVNLQSKELFLEEGIKVKPSQIVAKPRVGIDYAGEDAKLPLRFYIKGNPFISKV